MITLEKLIGPESELQEVIQEAQAQANKSGLIMAVVHAPIENLELIENGGSVYGYCPFEAVDMMFSAALKGYGQKNCPARGLIRLVNPVN